MLRQAGENLIFVDARKNVHNRDALPSILTFTVVDLGYPLN